MTNSESFLHQFKSNKGVTGKETQTELIEGYSNYNSLLELSPDAILIHTQSQIVYANESAIQLFEAKDEGDLLGRSILETFHPAMYDLTIQDIENTSPSERQILLEERLISLKKKEIVAEITGGPITYKGKPSTQVLIRDITLRRQNEKALKKLIGLVAPRSGADYFNNMVIGLAEALKADVTLIGLLDKTKSSIQTIALNSGGQIISNLTYLLKCSPCEKVIERHVSTYIENVAKLFPKDQLLQEMNINGYSGISLFDKKTILLVLWLPCLNMPFQILI